MNFLHNDLGFLDSGAVVEVSLDHAANIRLMDAGNFQSYRQGGHHQFFGGEARRSPIRLRVPQSGHWHVAIDLGGRAGTVRAGVRVFS